MPPPATKVRPQPEKTEAQPPEDTASPLKKLKELAEDYHLESEVEAWLVEHFSDLGLGAALIATQIEMEDCKKMDMLSIRSNGRLCVVELKRDTPEREVFAQILDYARLISGCLTADLDDLCQQSQKMSLADFFRLHFERKLPKKWPANPQLVIIAGAFDESLIQMATFLKEHHFDLKLIRYERNPADTSRPFEFHPVDISPEAFRVSEKMPACVVNLRFYESGKYQWNACRSEGWLPLPISEATLIHELQQDNPVHLLVYLDRHGYAGSGTLKSDFDLTPVSPADSEILLPVNWEFSLDFTQAVFRSQPTPPPAATDQNATSGKVVRLEPGEYDRWAFLMGQIKFRAAKATKNKK